MICDTVSATTGETLTEVELDADFIFDATASRLTVTPCNYAMVGTAPACSRSVILIQQALTIRSNATATPAKTKVASLVQTWNEHTRPRLKGAAADSGHIRAFAKALRKEYQTSTEQEDQQVIAIHWYTVAHEILRAFGMFKRSVNSNDLVKCAPSIVLGYRVVDTILWVWHCQLRQHVHAELIAIADLIVAYNNASKAKDRVKSDAKALAAQLVYEFDERVADAGDEGAVAVAMLRPFVVHAAQALLNGEGQGNATYAYEYKAALVRCARHNYTTTSLDALKVRYLKTLLSEVAVVDGVLVAKGFRGGLEQMLMDAFENVEEEEEEEANQKEQAGSSSAPVQKKKKPAKKKNTTPPPTTALFMRSGCVAFMRNRFFLYFAQDMLGEGFFAWCTIDFYRCPFSVCSHFLCTAHSLAVLDNCFVDLVRCKGEGYVRCTGKVSMTAGAHTATGESLDVLSVFYVF